jgi:YbbR domain-containing protein
MASRLREILFGNLGLKVSSLVLALLLYAHVVTEQPRDSVVQVPLTLTGLPESLVVTGQPPERVSVKVRGRWKDLIRLGLTSPYLPIDLAHATPGPYRTAISADDIASKALPPELSKLVTVNEVLEPRTVELVIEPKRVKQVRVAPKLEGEPAAGYRVEGTVAVVPESVRVSGPWSVVAPIESLRTLPIDITGEREKIQRQIEVDPGALPLSVEPRRCLVTVRFTRASSSETSSRP